MKKYLKNRYIYMCCFLFFMGIYADAKPTYSGKQLNFDYQTEDYILEFTEVYKGFNRPWGFDWYPSKNSSSIANTSYNSYTQVFLISERNGDVYLVHNTTIMKITGLPSDVYNNPFSRWSQSGWFDIVVGGQDTIYLSYAQGNAKRNTVSVIAFTLDKEKIFSTQKTIIAENIRVIYTMNPPVKSEIHFGGRMAVQAMEDKDILYVSFGERGMRNEAQNDESDHGSIIRIEIPYNTSLTVMPKEKISTGHRNPQGLFFDIDTQTLFETEHGPKGGDEFNMIKQGKNYGWPIVSWGKEYASGKQVGEGTSKKGLADPLYYWIDDSPALSGLSKYEGKAFKKWDNNFFVGALKYNQIYRMVMNNTYSRVVSVESILPTKNKIGRIRELDVGADGYIYVITDEKNGRLIRITPKE